MMTNNKIKKLDDISLQKLSAGTDEELKMLLHYDGGDRSVYQFTWHTGERNRKCRL